MCVFEGNLLFLCDVPFLLTELTSERRITSCYLAFSAAFERDEMGRKKNKSNDNVNCTLLPDAYVCDDVTTSQSVIRSAMTLGNTQIAAISN